MANMSKAWMRVELRTLLTMAAIAGVIAFIALLIPRVDRGGSDSARRTACIGNLRQIDGAKDQYALEYGPLPPNIVLTASNVEIYLKDLNKCFCSLLVGTNRTFENSYAINALTSPPTCKVGTNKNHDLAYTGHSP
jgi:hypothetical protein